MEFRFPEKAFMSQKLNVYTFFRDPSVKTFPQIFYITSQGEWNYYFSLTVFYQKSVSPISRKRRGEKTINQLNNMTMTWNSRLFTFYMIYNFFICDYFTVLLIKCVSYIVVVILLSLLCNHDNSILKKYSIEIATVTKNGFLLADSKFEVYQE